MAQVLWDNSKCLVEMQFDSVLSVSGIYEPVFYSSVLSDLGEFPAHLTFRFTEQN